MYLMMIGFNDQYFYHVFCRDLPELAKCYVMRVLFIDQPITKAAATSWVTLNTKQYVNVIIELCSIAIAHDG